MAVIPSLQLIGPSRSVIRQGSAAMAFDLRSPARDELAEGLLEVAL